MGRRPLFLWETRWLACRLVGISINCLLFVVTLSDLYICCRQIDDAFLVFPGRLVHFRVLLLGPSDTQGDTLMAVLKEVLAWILNSTRRRQEVPLITSAEVRNLARTTLQRAEARRFPCLCLDILFYIYTDLEVWRGEAMIIGIWLSLSLGGRLFPWRHVVIVPCFNLHYLYSLIILYRYDYENPSYESPKERKANG